MNAITDCDPRDLIRAFSDSLSLGTFDDYRERFHAFLSHRDISLTSLDIGDDQVRVAYEASLSFSDLLANVQLSATAVTFSGTHQSRIHVHPFHGQRV